jgi:PAS domain S-box-containing protein
VPFSLSEPAGLFAPQPATIQYIIMVDAALILVAVLGLSLAWNIWKRRISQQQLAVHKKQEREILRLSRLYRMLSQVNHAIIGAPNREELFEKICHAALDCGFAMAWIGWFDRETKRVRPVTSTGDTQGYLEQLQIVVDGRPEGGGGVGTAISTGKPMVINDFLSESCCQPWHALARAKGFQAVGGFPLRLGGVICATLAVYAREKDFFKAREIELLEEVSLDASFALDRLEKEAERQRMEDALRQAHQQLREQENHYRSLIENSSDIITLLREDGLILYCSPSSERLLGYRLDELVAHNVSELLHEESQVGFMQAMRGVVDVPDSVGKALLRFRHKDGSWRTHECIGRLFSAQPGAAPTVVVNSRDITERLQLEHQLRQAQKMEEIGRLVGGISHDFNNILTAVLIHLGMLKAHTDLNPEVQESLVELEQETQRAASLTRQLLLFSRKSLPQVKTLDLDKVIGNLAKMLRRVLGETIELELGGCPGAAWVSADAGMLEQVVMNLCINARDAMVRGGRLKVNTSVISFKNKATSANPQARPGRFVCLAIQDTGCGMSPEVLERLFEPFFTTKEAGKGTGLGLATVYGIIKQLEGWIEVESEMGQGTRFQIYLPALTEGAEKHSDSRGTSVMCRGNETILFVEDDAPLRRLGAIWLRKLGYVVLEARDGKEALEVYHQAQAPIDLLFTDIVMPGDLTGLELARILREKQPALKVLVSSGYHSEISKWSEGNGDDATRHLAKPYDAPALIRELQECLKQA